MKLYRFTLTPQSAMGTPLVGDTLFGQFCWAVRNRFGEARLIELLEGYTEQRPFIVVSDAFPQGFLPLPTLPSIFWETKTETDRKSLKKAQWVNISDVEKRAVHYKLTSSLKKKTKINSTTPLIAKQIPLEKGNLHRIQQRLFGLAVSKSLIFISYLMKNVFHWKNYSKF